MHFRTCSAHLFNPRVIHRPTAPVGGANRIRTFSFSSALNSDKIIPPIPIIRSEDIRTKVFTHRSFYARSIRVFEDHSDDPSSDNENYELLGDAVLGLVVINILMKMYPNLRAGPYTDMRSLITRNNTLATISCLYELPAQLRVDPSQETSVRTSGNVQADVFESYVGGLYLDQGLSVVEEWLEVLFRPHMIEAYARLRTQYGLPLVPPSVSPPLTPSSSTGSSSNIAPPLPHYTSTPTVPAYLVLLNEQLQKEKRDVKFYDECAADGTAITPTWTSRAEINGMVFGRGEGSTKKAARNEAAKAALTRMGIKV